MSLFSHRYYYMRLNKRNTEVLNTNGILAHEIVSSQKMIRYVILQGLMTDYEMTARCFTSTEDFDIQKKGDNPYW